MASPMLLELVLDERKPVIATVDGREENENFERMDLNTRWSGLALLDLRSVAALQDLPDGWSLGSSLLRQAMQSAVPMRLLRQGYVQKGDLRKIGSKDDAAQLTRQLLSRRIESEEGLVEGSLFGPAAATMAPRIWQSSSGALVLDAAAFGSAALSVASIFPKWTIASIAFGVIALMFNSARHVVNQVSPKKHVSTLANYAFWGILVAALFAVHWSPAVRPLDNIFAPAILAGLAISARSIALKGWTKRVLRSPALIASLLLGLTPVIGISSAVKAVSLAQMLVLITGLYLPKGKQ